MDDFLKKSIDFIGCLFWTFLVIFLLLIGPSIKKQLIDFIKIISIIFSIFICIIIVASIIITIYKYRKEISLYFKVIFYKKSDFTHSEIQKICRISLKSKFKIIRKNSKEIMLINGYTCIHHPAEKGRWIEVDIPRYECKALYDSGNEKYCYLGCKNHVHCNIYYSKDRIFEKSNKSDLFEIKKI